MSSFEDMRRSARTAALARRQALPREYHAAASAKICSSLLSLPEYQNANVIFSYFPVGGEVDVMALNRAAIADGKRLAFPVCQRGGIMHAYSVPDTTAVVCGMYGILQPDLSLAAPVFSAEIDLVIVPVVAFDEARNRLGHGAGYYDRYLPLCNHAKTIGVAFQTQGFPDVYPAPHDVALDAIITESYCL